MKMFRRASDPTTCPHTHNTTLVRPGVQTPQPVNPAQGIMIYHCLYPVGQGSFLVRQVLSRNHCQPHQGHCLKRQHIRQHTVWLWSNENKSHYEQLQRFLAKLQNSGITLKYLKCSFMVLEINFLVTSSRGMASDQTRLRSKLVKPSHAPRFDLFLALLLFKIHTELQHHHIPHSHN